MPMRFPTHTINPDTRGAHGRARSRGLHTGVAVHDSAVVALEDGGHSTMLQPWYRM